MSGHELGSTVALLLNEEERGFGLVVTDGQAHESTGKGVVMRHCRAICTAVGLAALTFPTVGLVAPASAASPWIPVYDVYTEEMEDFCDVPGLTVSLVSTAEGEFRFSPRGPDGLPHRMEHMTQTDVYTNVATGESVTVVELRNENVYSVTDNGDGTLTFLQLNVHEQTFYDEDGMQIGHSTGQLRVELVFEHAGTPTDLEDDEFVSIRIFNAVSHGDDFCETAVAAIG